MILLKILKYLLGEKFGKDRMVERERGEQKWNLDVSLMIKKRTDGETQETAKEKNMKEYWNERAHTYPLLLALAADSTKLFMGKS